MAKKLQSRRMKQGNVTAILYEVCRSIVVHNITEHYEEDYISMYFETSGKSGGGRVKTIHMLGEGEVVIVFEDPKGKVIYTKSNNCFSINIRIRIRIPHYSSPLTDTSSLQTTPPMDKNLFPKIFCPPERVSLH